MKIQDYMGAEQGTPQAEPQGVPPAEVPQQTPQQAQGVPPAGMEEGGNSHHEGEPVTEEEQADYDQVLEAASEVIYGDMSENILQMLAAGADDPAQAIADVALQVMISLDEKSDGTIPEEVIIPAAAEIAEIVGELAHQRGAFQVDDMVLGRAGQLLLIGIAEAYGIEEEDLQGIVESVDPQQLDQIIAQQSQYGVV